MSVPVAAPDHRTQVSSLIFAFVLIDPGGIIREANQSTENLLGKGASRLLGKPFRETANIVDERVARLLDEPDAVLTARGITIGDMPGKLVNLTISPVSAEPGWRVITLSDAGQADMADDPRPSDIAAPAVLAHEIKNPLAAIRGASQLLQRKLPEGDQGLARLVTAEVDRIARMIDRMQKLGSKQVDPLEPVNLHEVYATRWASCARSKAHSDIAEEFDPSLPAVIASRDALQQVLINLLGNARDACAGEDHPCVTIRTRYVTGLVMNVLRRGRGRSVSLPIEITVSDNGPGIDPAIAERVFEPFVTSKKGGQGLGLALVRKLVRDMDGRIANERDRSAGLTRFRIHLAEAKDAK